MTMPGGQQTDSRDATVTLRSNVDPYVQGMSQAEAQTNRTASAVDQLDAKLKSLSQRVSQGLVHFAERDFAGLSIGVATAATFDKQLGTLNATAAVTDQRMSGIKGAVTSTFTSMATSRTSVIQLIEVLNNLGVTGAKQLGQLAVTFTKLGEATGEGPTELAQGLVQLSRLMGVTDARQIGNYANSLLTVSKNAGVSATGVLSFAQAIAPLARQAGIGEASVLGISTAFSKAGADGFVAANTFNSIVSDITKLTQSGSPELSKYANLIGKTQAQFKAMDKTTALEQIFTTISKQGPEAINTLNRLGIDGVRAQSAISAVVQSGDLNKQVNTALNSAGDQKNLDKGAHAATDNLSDDLVKIRNQLTQFGTVFGETFMKPLKLGAEVVEGLLQALNALFKPIAPLVAGFAAIAGAVAGLAGGLVALGHVVGLGALAAFFIKGAPIRAAREGMAAGRGVVGETAEQRTARLAQNPSAVRYAAGGMPLRARVPYMLGRAAGGLAPDVNPNAPVGGPGAARVAVRAAVRAPFQMVGAAARTQGAYLNNATRADYDRKPYGPAPVVRPTPTGSARAAAAAEASARATEEETATRKGAIGSMRDWVKVQVAANRTSVESDGVMKAFMKTVAGATKDVAALGLQTGRAGARLLRGVPGSSVAGMGAGAAGIAERGAIRQAGSSIASGAKSLYSGVGGALGVGLLATAALPLLSNMLKGPADHSRQIGDDLSPITQYNQALGTASTNLATFGTALDKASTKLDNNAAGQSLNQVGKITDADRAKAATGKLGDKNIGALADASPKNTGAAVSYIQSLGVSQGFMDSKTLNSIKQDLIKSYGSGQAQKILNQYLATNPQGSAGTATPDFGALAKAAGGASNNEDYKKIAGAALSGIRSRAQVSPGTASNRAELEALGAFGTTSLANRRTQNLGYTKNEETFEALVRKATGAGKGLDLAMGPTGQVSSTAQIVARLVQTGGKSGAAYLSSAGIDVDAIRKALAAKGGTSSGYGYTNVASSSVLDLINTQLGTGKGSFGAPQQSEFARRVSGSGDLGAYAESNKTVQSAYNQPDNPGLQYQAMMNLYNQAGGGSKSTDQVTGAFDKLTGTINDTSDQLYIMARAAKSYAQQQEAYAMPYKSREGQLQQTAKDYRQAQITQRDHPTADSAGDLATAKGSYEQQLQAQTSYEIQSYQTAKAYGVQMERSAEDYHLQIYRSERDFSISMIQQQQDRNIQLERQDRDHRRQLSQQNATQAQSVYNPYQRVQPQMTNGAGTLTMNLGDENDRLRRQKKELDALHKAGLSDQAIQTLDLANPNNAQQLDRLIEDAKSDPNVIHQLNAQTATRVKLTKSLTQNDYNLGFQQTEANYQTSLKDASEDYDRQRERAVEAQQRSLSDMATDYNKMVARSAADLTTQMTELYGSFADNYDRTLAAINKSIGKYAPGLAKTLIGQLKAMQTDIQNTTDLYTGPTVPTVPSIPALNKDPLAVSQGSKNTTYQHAMGTISTVEHIAKISEGGHPEMVLPLDSRGSQFMAGMYQAVSMNVVKSMAASGYASVPSGGGGGGSSSYRVDNSTNFTGPITVQAQDPNEMARALEAKKKLNRLTSPARSAGTL